ACMIMFTMPIVVGITTVWELRPTTAAMRRTDANPSMERPSSGGASFGQITGGHIDVEGPLASLPTSPSRILGAWVLPLWLLGVAMLCGYRAASWLAAQRLRSRAVCAAVPEWQLRLNRLVQQLRMSRPVVMLESSLTDTPLTMGVLRPVILLPIGLISGLSVEQIELVLLHELAHIRRHDYLINLMQTAVESLLFYHPGVWWLSRRIRMEREYCCDDIVVAATDDATAYARALTELEHRRVAFNETALAATGGNLMFRIQRLLGRKATPKGVMSGPLAIVLLLASCVALLGWQSQSFAAQQSGATQVQSALNNTPAGAAQQSAQIAKGLKPNPFFHTVHEQLWNAMIWFHQLIGLPVPPKHAAATSQQQDKELATPAPMAARELDRPVGEQNSAPNAITKGQKSQTGVQTAEQRRSKVFYTPDAVRAPMQEAQAQFQQVQFSQDSASSRDQVEQLEQTRSQVEQRLQDLKDQVDKAQRAMREAESARNTLAAPYQKWLNEEVFWIISNFERRAFQQLQTDEQRQAFIEQFWLRRDPTPGTEQNEFRDEYYRRIAYANTQFAFPGRGGRGNQRSPDNLPGWKTDRGALYIQLGPPDSISGRGEGSIGGLTTTEVWRYNYIEGAGRDVELTFVNADGAGFRFTWNPDGKAPDGRTLYEQKGEASRFHFTLSDTFELPIAK
ncbi:MAG: M56 family metallopeptidase, partial [Acidobacteriota bacterium]